MADGYKTSLIDVHKELTNKIQNLNNQNEELTKGISNLENEISKKTAE